MKEIEFRRAGFQHRLELESLLDEFARYDGCSGLPTKILHKVSCDAFSDNPPFIVWMMFVGLRCVGLATVVPGYSTYKAAPTWQIEDLYIQASARGNGYGTKFFEFLKEEGKRQGCVRIDWSCDDGDQRAKRFYTHVGAKTQEKVLYCIDL